MDDGTAHAFGRIEGKLDRLFDEVSAQGRQLAEHGVRLDHVEGDVDELKKHRTTDQRQGVSFRAALLVGLCTAAASFGGSAVIAQFIK